MHVLCLHAWSECIPHLVRLALLLLLPLLLLVLLLVITRSCFPSGGCCSLRLPGLPRGVPPSTFIITAAGGGLAPVGAIGVRVRVDLQQGEAGGGGGHGDHCRRCHGEQQKLPDDRGDGEQCGEDNLEPVYNWELASARLTSTDKIRYQTLIGRVIKNDRLYGECVSSGGDGSAVIWAARRLHSSYIAASS